MSFQPVQFLFAVSLALSLSTSHGFSQDAYDLKALKAVTDAIKESGNVKKCNPFIDPGCHVPGTGGPIGCTDCAPSDFAEALRNKGKFIMLDELVVNGSRIKLLEENKGGEMMFSLPGQTGE